MIRIQSWKGFATKEKSMYKGPEAEQSWYISGAARDAMRLEVSELGVGQSGREVRWMEEWAGPDPTRPQGPQEGVEPSLQWEAGLWHGEVCLFERFLWLLSE